MAALGECYEPEKWRKCTDAERETMSGESMKLNDTELINVNFGNKTNSGDASNDSNAQPAHDVLRTSPEGPLKVLTSGTYRGLSGASQGTNTKMDDLMKKLFIRCNCPGITHLFLFFTGRANIQKF